MTSTAFCFARQTFSIFSFLTLWRNVTARPKTGR